MKKHGKYEKKTEKRSRRYLWGLLPIAVLALILFVGFAVNRWTVELTLIGEPELQIECGADYTDPGAEAHLTAAGPGHVHSGHRRRIPPGRLGVEGRLRRHPRRDSRCRGIRLTFYR